MSLLLPLVGGLLAGWLAPRRAAIALQVAFAIVAATVMTASAPMHGADYGVVVWVVPLTIVVSVVSLGLGMMLRHRRLAL